MIPIWLMLLALVVVFIENGVRSYRRERAWRRGLDKFVSARDAEFQRLHVLADTLREEMPGDRRARAVRQLHAELTKVHRAAVLSGERN